ncbi:MAG: hypothetical protein H6Q43_836 [Deltaproteobacteria bacterium]|jgi:hypothetical protein|nr:hypothetical protein [Deltaproteobacteria bacterium]
MLISLIIQKVKQKMEHFSIREIWISILGKDFFSQNRDSKKSDNILAWSVQKLGELYDMSKFE